MEVEYRAPLWRSYRIEYVNYILYRSVKEGPELMSVEKKDNDTIYTNTESLLIRTIVQRRNS